MHLPAFPENMIQRHFLGAILCLGLLHGLIYTFLTPPWWHHDEAGHFEYAWLVANHTDWPEYREYDEGLRRELAQSLERYGYYAYTNYRPDLTSDQPLWIGFEQTEDPPLYYAIASLPLRLIKNTDLAVQNRVLRLLSLGVFLLTLWMCWELGGELFGVVHPLRGITTIFLALLPGFVNEMTSISNEPLVTLLFSVFLLASVRMLRHGFSWKQFILLMVGAVAGALTKNTIWVAVPLLASLLLLFMIFDKRWKWVPLAVLLIAFLAGIRLGFQWGDARYWYQSTPQDSYTRQRVTNAPLGDYVLQIARNNDVRQFISAELIKPQYSKTLTLGFWAWADTPVSLQAPRVIFSSNGRAVSSQREKIKLGTSPAFYSFQIQVPPDSDRGWLVLTSHVQAKKNTPYIFLDGMVLVEGVRSATPPQFTDAGATAGTWDGYDFVNLVRNGSAESSWARVSPVAWNMVNRFYPYKLAIAVASLQDWQGTGWYYRSSLVRLNETFWGKFGASYVPLLGQPYIYQFLRVIGFLGFLGALVFFWKNYRRVDKRLILFLGLGFVIFWGQTLIRGAGQLGSVVPFLPWARYALPAIIPTVAILCAGWFTLLSMMENILIPARIRLVWPTFIAFMLGVDILSILTMIQFFYLQTQWPYLFLLVFLQITLLLAIIMWKQQSWSAKTEYDKKGQC